MFYKWLPFLFLLPGLCEGQQAQSPLLYQENGLWGLMDAKPITPAVYDILIPINNGKYYIAKKHKSTTLINSKGVISANGKIIIPFNYLDITPISGNFIVKKWEHNQVIYGVLSPSNKIILNSRFKMIQSINSYWIVSSASNELQLYNANGEIIKEIFADSISLADIPEYMYTYKGGKIGLSNYAGEEIYPPNYKTVAYKNEFWKTTFFNQWQVISKFDTTLIYADSLQIWDAKTFIIGINSKYQIANNNAFVGKTYSSICKVAPSFAIVQTSNSFGAIRKNGQEILPTYYRNMYYKKGYFYAYKNHNWSVFDSLGQKRSVFEYDSIGEINDGLFPIKRKGKWGFMNRDGKEVIHCIYDSKAYFKNGKAIINYFGASGIIDTQGAWIVKPLHKEITEYSFNFYINRIDTIYYLKNYTNELIYFTPHQLIFKGETIYEVRPHIISEISSLGTKVIKDESILEGPGSWQIIKVENKYGFYDTKGILVITYRYDSLQPFSEDLAAFKLRGKWGFLNADEQIIIQPHFTAITPFKNGLSTVSQHNEKGLINARGKFMLKPKYESIQLLKNDVWLVTEKGLTGLFNSKGHIIIQPKYDRIEYVHNNLIILLKNNKFGAVNINGVSVLPRVYNYIGYNVTNELLLLKKDN